MVRKALHYNTTHGFGTSTQRFLTIGFHPGLDTLGIREKSKSNVAPGSYNLQLPKWTDNESRKKILAKPITTDHPVIRNPDIQYQRFRETCLGPGTYDIIHCSKKKQSSTDSAFGGNRILHTAKHDNPPAGSYNIRTAVKKQFTHLQIFEWDGFVDRFKRSPTPWMMAPNRYNPKDDKSIDGLFTKVVSLRGPYDLFTGPRDSSTIKGYFATPPRIGTDAFITIKTDLEILLNHPSKDRIGKFGSLDRFGKVTNREAINNLALSNRNPKDPGPASYYIPEKLITPNKYPFNMSRPYIREPIKWKINPGAGRYSLRPYRCTKAKQPNWVFKSVLQRCPFDRPINNDYCVV